MIKSLHDQPGIPCNTSDNPLLNDRLPASPARRRLLTAGTLAWAGASLPMKALAAAAGRASRPLANFTALPVSTDDLVHLPAGYQAQLLFAWGDPVSGGPRAREDASDSAADQLMQAGMHHDGMHFFPFIEDGKPSSDHGLMCINHEYTDDGLLHPDGMENWSAGKVEKAKAAVGVSVIEVRRRQDGWEVVRPSRWGRRIHADTPCCLAGPAAGHGDLRTYMDPRAHIVLGTLNNCAMGVTPWGTYLTCEENFNNYFKAARNPSADQKRYGLTEGGSAYRWHEFDERFDLEIHSNEANRFGWVVEIDPWQPHQPPIKRTALGRFKHEGATTTLARDGRVVVYMGDDERFEYIYKFVSDGRYHPGRREANADLLDQGTLYVARFDPDGTGRWLPLRHGESYPKGALNQENGFADQGDVVIRCRQAADLAGATKMDRPEWIAVHPETGEAYVSLTNNSQREESGITSANPRANNVFGHIARWREKAGDAAALAFEWDLFARCGDPSLADPGKRGDIRGDAYGSPDGLWFDPDGRLWIQTDVATSALNRGDYANLGNNQMLLADTVTGETRRFLTGPRGCEVTGITTTPDRRTLFVNIQHPGESAGERSDPSRPTAISNWPANQFKEAVGGRPRSATIAITRIDNATI